MAMPWSTQEFYFDADEMRELFPAAVVDWMVAHPPGGETRQFEGRTLHPWPAPDELPVIVPTRMSLSFPVLISAVRLWAVDYTLPLNQIAAAIVSYDRRVS